jgi:hypothetical protein
MAFADSGANECCFGTDLHDYFLVEGSLRRMHGHTMMTAGSEIELTHTGTAAAAVTRNDGKLEYIISPNGTFSTTTPSDLALWSEAALTGKHNRYTMIKHNGEAWMSQDGTVTRDDPSAVILDTTTFQGLFALRTVHGQGNTPASHYKRHMHDSESARSGLFRSQGTTRHVINPNIDVTITQVRR